MRVSPANDNWLLPAAIEELRPPYAETFFNMQTRLLRVLFSYGYRLVLPPTVEYAHALVLNDSPDLERELVVFGGYDDHAPLALRADLTPQAARIDAAAKRTRAELPNRLCYCGEVFRRHSRTARNPLHLGGELFGEAGLAADLEIINVLADCIAKVHSGAYVLSLGHAALCDQLLRAAKIKTADAARYRRLLAAKTVDRIAPFVAQLGVAPALRSLLTELPHLYGDERVLAKGLALAKSLKTAAIERPLLQLRDLSRALKRAGHFQGALFFDLGEVPGAGYAYHNGPVFGLYLPGDATCFAKGGRYDAIGAHYGQGRPATGFGLDLGAVLRYVCRRKQPRPPDLIFAPYAPRDHQLAAKVRTLRAKNARVVCGLHRRQEAAALGCTAVLVNDKGGLANPASIAA